MKWLISSTVLLLLLFLSANAQEDGAGWLKRIDDAERVQHMVGEVDQIISTSSGAKRTLSLKSWSAENGDISLMAYTAPEEKTELVKVIAITENGCIAETLDGFAVKIGDCYAQPGQYVNALVDQKTKERAALMNPTN